MQEFEQAIYTILAESEQGKLFTYGQLAKLAGFPHHARHVGKVLGNLPTGSKIPWHRVVNAQGKISLSGACFIRQKEALIKEGINIDDKGKIVNFKQLKMNYS